MSVPPPDPGLPGLENLVAKNAKKPAKLKPVKVGAVSLPIYHYGDGRWTTIYRQTKGGRRITESRKTEAAIRERAAEICLKIARGQVRVDRLTPDELLQAVTARDLLAPHGLSLDGAAREIAAAVESTGASLSEMARFWGRHHQSASASRPALDILTEMIAAKKSQGLNAEYLRNVREPLEKFAAAFPGPFGEISTKEIRLYLEKLPVGPITKNHLRASIVMLSRFAQVAKDLPDDRKTEAEKVGRWKEPQKLPSVYTPREMSRWLSLVQTEWLPWMALGAFAGVRTDEIEEMDWSDIQWITREIYIRPEIAKTGRGRYVPLHDNLSKWLLPHRKGTGKIVPEKGRVNLETARMTAVSKAAGGPAWKANALRHSYGSHRYGILQDMGKLTKEMGNSIKVNEKNYQNPRSRQECVEYFNLYPAGKGIVIGIDGAAG